MKKHAVPKLLSGLLVAFMLGVLPVFGSPIPIDGSISFIGLATVNTSNLATATKFVSFSHDSVAQDTGDYAGLTGTPVTFSPFTFYTGGGFSMMGITVSSTPVAGGNLASSPLWTFALDGMTYSFNATGTISVIQEGAGLTISGTGLATIIGDGTDYLPTVGSWTIEETNTGSSFAFGASAGVMPTPGTPDSGSTILLAALGIGSIGLGLAIHRYRRRVPV
jgi:hypothetical protein